MRAIIGAVVVGAVIFSVVFLLSGDRTGPTPGASAAPGYMQKDRGEGGVEIRVTYVTAEYLRTAGGDAKRFQPDKFTIFLVALDTHSVDLAGYDLSRLSELRAGPKTYTPLRWERVTDSSHHRSGALIFERLGAGTTVELVIKNIAGVPARVFRWAP